MNVLNQVRPVAMRSQGCYTTKLLLKSGEPEERKNKYSANGVRLVSTMALQVSKCVECPIFKQGTVSKKSSISCLCPFHVCWNGAFKNKKIGSQTSCWSSGNTSRFNISMEAIGRGQLLVLGKHRTSTITICIWSLSQNYTLRISKRRETTDCLWSLNSRELVI